MESKEIYFEFVNKIKNLSKEELTDLAINSANELYAYYESHGLEKRDCITLNKLAFSLIAFQDGILHENENILFNNIFGEYTKQQFQKVMIDSYSEESKILVENTFSASKSKLFDEAFLKYCLCISLIDNQTSFKEASLIYSLVQIYKEKYL